MSKKPGGKPNDSESKHLPIYRHKTKLVQAVKDNPFLLVTGETGSGKTTQLPQYLYDAGELSLYYQERKNCCQKKRAVVQEGHCPACSRCFSASAHLV